MGTDQEDSGSINGEAGRGLTLFGVPTDFTFRGWVELNASDFMETSENAHTYFKTASFIF